MRITVTLALGKHGAVKLNLAAIGAGINLYLQRTCKEMGQIRKQKSCLAELNLFPAKAIHFLAAAQTAQLFHSAFSTAAMTSAMAVVSTVSMRPLS